MSDDKRMYRLVDGREFPWNTELPRIEREVVDRHLENLRGRDKVMRDMYLEELGRSEGQAMRRHLDALFQQEQQRLMQHAATVQARRLDGAR